MFGFNRPGLLSFYERDHHGDGSTTPLKAQIEARVQALLDTATGGPVAAILCLPRVLGFVFNPIHRLFLPRPALGAARPLRGL